MKISIVSFFLSLVLIGQLIPTTATAVEIEVTSGNWRPQVIHVDHFPGERALPYSISQVISDDLTRSGSFRTIHEELGLFGLPSKSYSAKLRNQGIEYSISGAVTRSNNNQLVVSFQLIDTVTDELLGSFEIPFPLEQSRAAAHQISNWLYEKITNKPGIFHTKIAFVLKNTGQYDLYVADYDGYNSQVVLSNSEPIMSPTWDYDGNSLVYVSFEQRKPIIYSQSLLSGARQIIANYPGSNSAPAVSPQGNQVAMALSKDGGTQIFFLSRNGSRLEKMRTSQSIDTSPEFSPNGKQLVFVSDESGAPQIFLYDLAQKESKRISFGYKRCDSPSYTKKSQQIFYVCRDKVGFNLYSHDLISDKTSNYTKSRLITSPTVSPNNEMVLYSDESSAQKLYLISLNGKVKTTWDINFNGIIKSPTWGPATSNWY